MSTATFRGTYTALVTPFNNQGKFDRHQLEKQIEFQIAGGVQGIVPVGTTGESPTLSHQEHGRVIQMAVKIAHGRVKVLAGSGSNSTEEAIQLTLMAERYGADGSLQVSPYYNKPTQEGLFQHFDAIARSTKLPIILYNIPGRCMVDITVPTVCRLRDKRTNIVGIKEASGSSDRVTELRLKLGEDFTILSGDDSLTLPFMSVGANGVISVVSNVLPALVNEMVLTIEQSVAVAQKIHAQLYPLTKSLFLEGNPVGVKCAMRLLKRDSGFVRSPLSRASKATEDVIGQELMALGKMFKL
ncbi:MAG: 4-hydroxy-tetrahydrodipicolinate synthase [Patescibacteria group bacterium]